MELNCSFQSFNIIGVSGLLDIIKHLTVNELDELMEDIAQTSLRKYSS